MCLEMSHIFQCAPNIYQNLLQMCIPRLSFMFHVYNSTWKKVNIMLRLPEIGSHAAYQQLLSQNISNKRFKRFKKKMRKLATTPVKVSNRERSHSTCDCHKNGFANCNHKRWFSQPDANWGWDSSRNLFFYGYNLYLFTDAESGLPVFPILEGHNIRYPRRCLAWQQLNLEKNSISRTGNSAPIFSHILQYYVFPVLYEGISHHQLIDTYHYLLVCLVF